MSAQISTGKGPLATAVPACCCALPFHTTVPQLDASTARIELAVSNQKCWCLPLHPESGINKCTHGARTIFLKQQAAAPEANHNACAERPPPPPFTTTQNHHATTHTQHQPAAATADGCESSANQQAQPHPHCQHENARAWGSSQQNLKVHYVSSCVTPTYQLPCPGAHSKHTRHGTSLVTCILPFDMQGNRPRMHQAASSTQAQPNG
jgi:hypothetical protein